jgi:hypothetical protein
MKGWRGKKETDIIAGSKSFTLCNRSTSPFNDHRNYAASTTRSGEKFVIPVD